ncbi:hypothetical protein F6Q07_22405 [Pectobacterium parmentieri]|nr:hypothetical protein [Pectobacterium parmentieri]
MAPVHHSAPDNHHCFKTAANEYRSGNTEGCIVLTQNEISAYQKSCIQRSCVVGYEGQSLCANCNADLHPFETHVCDECAGELLEQEKSDG